MLINALDNRVGRSKTTDVNERQRLKGIASSGAQPTPTQTSKEHIKGCRLAEAPEPCAEHTKHPGAVFTKNHRAKSRS